MPDGADLGLGLLLMVGAAYLFTQSMEWVGGRLGLSHAATGGILAAVGTALPESIVPVVALVRGGPSAAHTAVGAILGAPFMLATLGFGVTGAVCLFSGRRWLGVEEKEATSPLYTFVIAFVLLMLGAFAPRPLRYADAAVLVVLYLLHVRRSLRSDGGVQPPPAPPPGDRLRRGALAVLPPGFVGVGAAVVAVAGLAVASELFVVGLEGLSTTVHLSALVLALLLVPVATELPELTAGTFWILRGRDRLAFGNVTGAMAFQATVPALIGLCFTPWNPGGVGFLAAAITLAAALLALAAASRRGVDAWVLAPVGIGMYALYLAAVVVGRS